MASGTPEFDPYHKWLGIPPKDQPPHFYRLLGVELFEADDDTIANAVEARMMLVKTFQSGRYGEYSQRLLNELSTARVVLLNPQRKAAYDETLRAEFPSPAQPEPPPSPPREPVSVHAGKVVIRPWRSLRTKSTVWIAAGAGLAAVLLLIVLGTVFSGGDTPPEASAVAVKPEPPSTGVTSTEPPADAASGQSTPPSDASGQTSPPPGEPAEPPTAGQQEPAEPDDGGRTLPPVEPGPEGGMAPVEVPQKAKPPEMPPDATPPPEAPPRSAPPAIPESEPSESAIPESEPAEPAKLPPPSGSQLRQSERDFRARFRSEFSRAKSLPQKAALARRFLAEANATSDDPQARYVLFASAAEMASTAGQLEDMLTAVDEMARWYEIDSLEKKAEYLSQTIAATRSAAGLSRTNLDVLETAVALARSAAEADRYPIAIRFAEQAQSCAKKSGDKLLRDEVKQIGPRLEKLRDDYAPIAQSLELLKKSPDDPEANQTVAQWYLSAKGDWERGLPFLARGSDPALRPLAVADLAAPEKAAEQLALGKAWFAEAGRRSGNVQIMLARRARYWIKQAAPFLRGPARQEATRQLQQIDQIAGPEISQDPGAVELGNVASTKNRTRVEGASGAALVDGQIPATVSGSGIAIDTWPCQWTVTLPKVYRLREIRIKLPDGPKAFHSYALLVSPDGQRFVPLVDRSRTRCFGWQVIRFLSRPVKAIRLQGVSSQTGDGKFYVSELEAYCLPPN